MFHKESEEKISGIPPPQKNIPFHTEEIQKAVKCPKHGKSPGIDNLMGDMIKYKPREIYKGIADIFNEITETGTYSNEIKEGILIPLPNLGKKPGPPGHLRPIILLPVLRKILAIFMIRRSMEKINYKIPASQATYLQGRSTTEQVFSIKALAEKAITSENYKITMLILDML